MNRRALLAALAGLPFCKGLLPEAEAKPMPPEMVRDFDNLVDSIEWDAPLSPYEGLVMQGWVGPQRQYDCVRHVLENDGVAPVLVRDELTMEFKHVRRDRDGLWFFVEDAAAVYDGRARSG